MISGLSLCDTRWQTRRMANESLKGLMSVIVSRVWSGVIKMRENVQDKGFFFSPVGRNEALSCGAASHSGSVGFNVLQKRGREAAGGGIRKAKICKQSVVLTRLLVPSWTVKEKQTKNQSSPAAVSLKFGEFSAFIYLCIYSFPSARPPSCRGSAEP